LTTSVCIAGIFRIYYLYRYFNTYDVFWAGSILFILATIETQVGIICGCLPGIKPLLAHWCPHYFGCRSHLADTAVRYDPNRHSFTRLQGVRLPGARFSIQAPARASLRHEPSVVSMVEFPIKLDDGWGPVLGDPLEAIVNVGRVPTGRGEVVDAHPGRRVSSV
jgi:hypothetical protein